MSRQLAHVISIIFHPLLLATYLFSGAIVASPMMVVPPGYTKIAQWLIVLVVWLTTFAIPALSLAMLKFTGNIRSLKLENRQERYIPFGYITLFYAFTAYYFSQQMLVTQLASGMFVLTTVMILAAAIVNIFWKISVHALGMGGVVGLVLVISMMLPESNVRVLLMAVLLIAGLVAMARLRLQAHTPAQVYAGFVLGLFTSFMIIFWF